MKYQRQGQEIRKESLTRQVHALLRRRILAGEFKPGERIEEKALAQRLSISRTPVREALIKLEEAGIVVCNSRRSYNVQVLTAAGVKEIFDTLGILEGAIVSSVTEKITAKDIKLLKEYNSKMERAAVAGNWPAFGRWNRKFHDVFVSKAKNQTMQEICNSVHARLYTFPVRVGHSGLADWLKKKSSGEHREIIRLMVAKDSAGLESYFRNVHWSYERNKDYIEGAFDHNGEAAVHF